MLAALHRESLPEILPLAPHVSYAIPAFDTDALQVEIGLMPEWYLPDRGIELTRRPARRIRHDVARFIEQACKGAENLGAARLSFPNLIWLDQRPGIAKVGIIDFQDTVLGPAAYDLASLLQDARIDVPEPLELALLTRYIKARRASDETFDPAGFAEIYAIMSAQRNTKLLGIFAR